MSEFQYEYPLDYASNDGFYALNTNGSTEALEKGALISILPTLSLSEAFRSWDNTTACKLNPLVGIRAIFGLGGLHKRNLSDHNCFEVEHFLP